MSQKRINMSPRGIDAASSLPEDAGRHTALLSNAGGMPE